MSSNEPSPLSSSNDVVILEDCPAGRRLVGVAAAAAETIELLDDDDNDDADNLRAQYEAATLKAFADDKKKLASTSNKKSKASKSSSNTSSVAAGRRGKRCKISAPDAIDVDGGTGSSHLNDPAALYRQRLGPLRLEFIDAFRHHFYTKEKQHPSLQKQMPKLYKELLEYRLNLPSETTGSIFVRVLESRMDIIRAMITGPEDTPYANGCFFFDIFLDDYPKSPPKVCFLTTGNGKVRFNPNLYKCGKVCLSLLGTWSGPSWVPNQSTLLQVLVSIQGLILVPEPFYNEPGYTKSKANEKQSELYDKNTRRSTLQHGICDYLDAIFPPAQRAAAAVSPDYPEFQTILIRHFCQRAPAILIMIDDWVKQDASLRTTTNRIRSQLDKLVQEYGQQPAKQDETLVDSDAEGDKKPAAKPTPQVYEIDD